MDEWKGFSRPKSSLEGLGQPPGRLPSAPSDAMHTEGEEGDSLHSNEISDLDSAHGEIPDDEIPDDVRFLGLDDEA